MKVAIVGGGLAGAAVAYFLKQYDTECTLFDSAAEIASGASGNPVGMYNPRLSATLTNEAVFYRDAFELVVDVLPRLEDVGFAMCGALHLVTDERKKKRFAKMVESWGWGEDMVRLVSAAEASDIAGVALDYDALYMPKAGMVSPRRVCGALSKNAEIVCDMAVSDTSELAEFDAVVLACGLGAMSFEELNYLPLKMVRGQITQVRANAVSVGLKVALGYGGYFTPAVEGVHTIGATFDRDAAHDEVHDADDAENIARLAGAVPAMVEDGLEVVSRRASVRVTSQAYLPAVGSLPAHLTRHDNVYVSIAHASHGITTALKAGELLAQMITGSAVSLPDEVLAQLSPSRYN